MVVTSKTDEKGFYEVSQLCKATIRYLIHKVPEDKRYIHNSVWYVCPTELPNLFKRAKETGIHTTLEYSSLPQNIKITIDFILGKKRIQTSMPNDYTTLFLTPDAPPYIIEAVWKAILKTCHPDVGGDSEAFLKYKAAYERLKRL